MKNSKIDPKYVAVFYQTLYDEPTLHYLNHCLFGLICYSLGVTLHKGINGILRASINSLGP
jgi:hypothetical protein